MDNHTRFDGEVWYPDEVLAPFRSTADEHRGVINKYDPDRTVISYSEVYGVLWDWMMANYELPVIMPPPLIVDYRDDPPHSTRGGKIVGLGMASFNSYTRYFDSTLGQDENGNTLIRGATIKYECRVYHKNILQRIRNTWGEYASGNAIIFDIAHTLIHEIFHYITHSEYIEACYSKKSPQEYEKAIRDYTAFVYDIGSEHDETTNEDRALSLFNEWAMRSVLALQHSRDRIADVDLTVIPGGPYDLFLREKNETYRMNSMLVELENIGSILDYKRISNDECKRLNKRKAKIISTLSNHFKRNRFTYMLIE